MSLLSNATLGAKNRPKDWDSGLSHLISATSPVTISYNQLNVTVNAIVEPTCV